MSPSPFRPVPNPPDLPALERDMLTRWASERTFERLREQNAGSPTWSFLDGPITANNPMGVHHAWGRTYKDLFQRYHAMLGHDQRFQNGFDCQGLWVEVNVERDQGFTSKRDIERFGIAEFVSLCKQRVLTFAARQTEQSIRLGMWMDWNDPAELLRLRDLLAADPSQVVTVEGPRGPVTDTVEMIVGRLGMPELGGSYFTFSNENNDLIWGFLAECHRRGWLYRGHDTMPWCARCGTGLSQMEMNEGYADRDDPGLTVRLPLLDRPGEDLLVWTTTPWTLTSNVAAAVGADLTYVRVRQGEDLLWVARGTLRSALEGPFEVLEERPGRELVGWTYAGPFDDLPQVRAAFEAWPGEGGGEGPYRHRVVAWDQVGEEEGTGIVHIAPGCGAEDFALGKSLGLPVVAPLDESGIFLPGFDWLSGMDVSDVAGPIVDHLRADGRFYRLETYRHRYPHCWRCHTPLVFRLVDEWYISMGPLYDRPREELTDEEVERSLRYQIMDVVDDVRWIPGFGRERELDWLRSMQDWMISKKRYWGLALPIYPCEACGTVDVIGGREELRERAVEGWGAFQGHTPHRPYIDAVRIACSGCGAPVSRIADVGNPWLDAGIVPFSTLHYREDPDHWKRWFPADFITESLPGQFRNWFYSLLAMSTVLRREAPFRTILGYATLFDEDGRPMHKSWGNSIEFDEAAERMGVDVMRWMYVKQRPEDNILFGYGTADEARRELLVLWNVLGFFVTYARQARWSPPERREDAGSRNLLDRWILSRTARLGERVGSCLDDFDARAAASEISGHLDELSTWYLRRSRRRFSLRVPDAERSEAFTSFHRALTELARVLAPILPFFAEELYGRLQGDASEQGSASVHLTRWPAAELAQHRDDALERDMDIVLRAVDLGRTLRAQAGIRVRQPLGRLWLALPAGALSGADRSSFLDLIAEELNVKRVETMADDSELLERRVRPLLPALGPRLGGRIPAVMAAARANDVEFLAGGGVRLAGIDLSAEEVEILATPRPGTAVAHAGGLVVVIDTTLTDELRAEGHAREVQRALQDLRKDARLELEDRVEAWLDGPPELIHLIRPFLPSVAEETNAVTISTGLPPDGVPTAEWSVDGMSGTIGLRALARAA